MKDKRKGSIKIFVILLIIISLVFSIAYLTLLNSKVTNKLEGALWTLPAKLYSRPLELAEGSNIFQLSVPLVPPCPAIAALNLVVLVSG